MFYTFNRTGNNRKYLVFESRLLQLAHMCVPCGSQNVRLDQIVIGTFLRLKRQCIDCDAVNIWESQPFLARVPAGNIHLTASILCSGSLPTKVLRMMDYLNVANVTAQTFYRHQKHFLLPAIERTWKSYQEQLLATAKARGGCITLAGDGRADSPGHSAKFGTYTCIDVQQNAVLDIKIVQVSDLCRF